MKINKRQIISAIAALLVVVFVVVGVFSQPDDSQTVREVTSSTESTIESSNESESETSESDSNTSESETEEETSESTSENTEVEMTSSTQETETKRSSTTSERKNKVTEETTTKRTETTTAKKPTPTSAETTTQKAEQVFVTVDMSSIGKGTLSYATTYRDGMTAMDATTQAFQAAGLSYSVVGSGASAYMEGINNVFEFDYGPLSGWQVTVDGVHITVGAGSYGVHENSQVVWTYTEDFTQ